jgi:small subunit ribosomal protein S23
MNARKSARNVPSTISRLLKSNAFLKSPPPAYYPLLAHPPAPSLVRSLPARPIQDLPASLVDPSLQPYQSHRAAERKRQGVKEQSKDTMEEIMVKATRRRPPRAANTKRSQPLPIVFAEDELRRQFFRDHPFEAYRPVFLAESESVQGPPGPSGAAWTALSQRTTIPTAEE